ncbi:hypothetical protein BKA67DRAFT_326145 [Truncatella angustata]|uniref:Beta-glucuronidase n=1 Tax=Truncatella angustata TaxID=152316 RepID=A0A9P8UJZ9_9PEZI|nr:uncharacterized protein BKA67DRAFT_326145 [Truncatella angustata]KAH6653607.1 hypothetical protein BKA67DRAFT_326145 [Truncatella angustata]
MLKPQQSSTRQLVTLDGIWNFSLSSGQDTEAEKIWTNIIPPTLQAPVPSSYNDIFVDANIRDHVGWVYYQRQVVVCHGDGAITIDSEGSEQFNTIETKSCTTVETSLKHTNPAGRASVAEDRTLNTWRSQLQAEMLYTNH